MSIMATEDIMSLEDMEFSIPCDAASAAYWPDTPGPAEWAARHVCPGCGYKHSFLLCSDCKDYILHFEGHNSCHYCNHVEHTLRAFFTSFIPL